MGGRAPSAQCYIETLAAHGEGGCQACGAAADYEYVSWLQ